MGDNLYKIDEESELTNVTEVYELGIDIKIPKQYLPIYKAIIVLYAELGYNSLQDCKTFCKSRNKDIIDCYIMFETALSAFYNNNYKLCDTIMTTLKAQLNLLAKNNAGNLSFKLPLDNKGNINLFVVSNLNEPDDTELFIDTNLLNFLNDNFATKEDIENAITNNSIILEGTLTNIDGINYYIFNNIYENNIVKQLKAEIGTLKVFINHVPIFTAKNTEDINTEEYYEEIIEGNVNSSDGWVKGIKLYNTTNIDNIDIVVEGKQYIE